MAKALGIAFHIPRSVRCEPRARGLTTSRAADEPDTGGRQWL